MKLRWTSGGVMSQEYTYSCLTDTNSFIELSPSLVDISSYSSLNSLDNPMSGVGTHYMVNISSATTTSLNETIIE